MKSLIEKDMYELSSGQKWPDLSGKSVLITGGTGLIGINFVNFFLSLGASVSITIRQQCSVHEKIFPELKNVNINVVDFKDDRLFEFGEKYDYIIHAAGYSSPARFMEEQIQTIKIGYATNDLLKLLKPDGKFLFISSSEVYSGLKRTRNGYDENEIGCVPINHKRISYIETKKMGEIIINLAREQGIDAKSVRVSLVYGPGIRYNDKRVLHDIIQKAITSKKIQLLDSGKSIRTYCYISDGIEMMANVLFYGKKNVYNIGGISYTTIYDLALKISEKIGDVKVIKGTYNNIGAPPFVMVNMLRYFEEFGNKSFVSLDDGLKNTIKWQKHFMDVISKTKGEPWDKI